MSLGSSKSNVKKIEGMTKKEKAFYLASGRVTVGTISQVVQNEEGRNVFKIWYVAKIRGCVVGDDGEWKHETEQAAREYGHEVLEHWKKDVLSGKYAENTK